MTPIALAASVVGVVWLGYGSVWLLFGLFTFLPLILNLTRTAVWRAFSRIPFPLLRRGIASQSNIMLLPGNSMFVTVMATFITLLIPPTIILVSLFFVVWMFGLSGTLWGVIIPAG